MADLELLKEAHRYYEAMQMSVEVLNLFRQYMAAEGGSDLENAIDDSLKKIVLEEIEKEDAGLLPDILSVLCMIIDETCDHEKVQEFLDEQNRYIEEVARRAYDS